MNRSTRCCVIALLLVVCGVCAACAPERPSEQTVPQTTSSEAEGRAVAVVNGEPISVAEFERRLNGMAPHARVRYTTPEKRAELLDSLIAFELLVDEAERRGFKDDPAVLFAMKDALVRRMLADELLKNAALSDITDAQVEDAYRARLADFRRPEQRRVALIEVYKQELADDLFARLSPEKIPVQQDRILAFRQLASKYAIDASVAQKGGDLGFLPPPDQADDRIEIARRAFELREIGDVSAPYKHRDRWNLVMLLDIKPPNQRPIASVAAELRQALHEQRRQQTREALIQKLKQTAAIDVNQAVLDSIPPPDVSVSLDDLKLGRPAVRDISPNPDSAPDLAGD